MAQVKNYLLYNTLANALQTVCGQEARKTHWIKFEAVDDSCVRVVHQSMVAAGHQSVQFEMQRKWREDAVNDIIKGMKEIEKEYASIMKTREKLHNPTPQPYTDVAPKSIKLELLQNSIQEVSEPRSYQLYTPIKQHIYKVFAVIMVK